jgi:hypothetical protein
MIPEIYLKVDDTIYYNELLARYISFKNNKPIEFVCYDKENALLDWTAEPIETFEELMKEHALNLQNRYDKIILLWSGGTDSQTIYEVMVQNNIHIDEIIVFHDDVFEPLSYPENAANWIINNHKDPLTKITPKERLDPISKSRIISDENWIFENSVMIPRFALGSHDRVMLDYCRDNYGGFNWCLVNGLEQPDVVSTPTGFYARHNALSYKCMLGFENSECFFTAPKLALKQAHMIKNFLKQQSIQTQGKPYRFLSSQNYTRWAKCIGRHREIHPGASFMQKEYESTFDKHRMTHEHIDSDLTARVDAHFRILNDKDSNLIKNFKRGIQTVLAEKDFCEHLIKGSPVRDNSVIGKWAGERIYSRSFFIGN